MMSWLVSRSLRHAPVIVVLAIVGAVAALRESGHIPLDVFPEFAPPLVEVQTEAPGLSTPEVEALVSVPIENALSGIPGVDVTRSKSVLGLSSVVLILDRSTDLMDTRQMVQERVARLIPSLPAVAHAPVMLSPLSSLSRVMKIGVSSDTLSQVQLTTLIRWTVRPQLMALPGVANVAIWGQRDRQLQVLVDPDRLAAHNVTLDAVVAGRPRRRRARDRRLSGHAESATRRGACIGGAHPRTTSASIIIPGPRPSRLRLGDVATIVEGIRRRLATPSSTTGRAFC